MMKSFLISSKFLPSISNKVKLGGLIELITIYMVFMSILKELMLKQLIGLGVIGLVGILKILVPCQLLGQLLYQTLITHREHHLLKV